SDLLRQGFGQTMSRRPNFSMGIPKRDSREDTCLRMREVQHHRDRQLHNHTAISRGSLFWKTGLNCSLWRARDPQLIHLVCQRRPFETQASCRSTSASDNPIAFAERSQNLFSLGLLQCIASTEAWVIQNFSQRYSQRWTRG